MKSNWRSFETITPGKWVLSGEHTVLRGGRAIALPHPDFKLKFSFEPSNEPLSVIPDLASVATQDLLRTAREWLAGKKIEMSWPKGEIMIESTIPFGAGLGSSAAYSVAVARWILSAHGVSQDFEIELGRKLEDRFHGTSSGMDVSVVSIAQPILFSMKEGAKALTLEKLPQFLFIDTGLRSSTKDCIERVARLREKNPEQAELLDEKMASATTEILFALKGYEKNESGALEKIARAMNSSREVFEAWGLNPPEIASMFQESTRRGSVASRLTGAGSGGFIVGVVS